MKKYTQEEKLFGLPDQYQVMNEYKILGFVNDKRDEQGLHMAFSPKRVPKGLTKLQVRRRIDGYYRKPEKSLAESLRELVGNRIEIIVNGKLMVGASFSSPVPTNRRQLKKLLKMVFQPGRDVPDPEVLGKYSPK